MGTHSTGQSAKQPPWLRRLMLPAYRVKDAARYARVSPQTILNWQRTQGDRPTISHREDGRSLSYLQLIELAVVAAMREAGVSLAAIRSAREYMAQRLTAEYPFAEHSFKTDGKQILMNLTDFEKNESPDKLIVVSKNGQLGWRPILDDRLKEFEYSKGLAVRWNLAGKHSPVSIDPQVSFGAPAVRGIPTWTIKGRLDAGETVEEIAEDFILDPSEVREALQFEGVDVEKIKSPEWSH